MRVFPLMVWVIVTGLSLSSFSLLPQNFGQAKKVGRVLFQGHRQTLYCRCTFDARMQVDLQSCGMMEASAIKRAHRIEWEHMVPAENFGRQFTCWREPICTKANGKPYKGRKCCEKMDKAFQQAEAELYNLWPAVGLVNQVRSNYRYDALTPKTSFYGCPFTVDKANRRVEPADYAKGTVARASLFMAEHYHLRLSEAQRRLLTIWNQTFPPDTWEQDWARQVAALEGYKNPYITHWIKPGNHQP